MMKIAVVLTCFNRKLKTVSAIEKIAVMGQKLKCDISFFICDDNSTDGTKEVIRHTTAKCEIISGAGDLYWSRGMYEAMRVAVDSKADFFLMINDDVEFLDTALETMLISYKKADCHCGIVGSTLSNETNDISYGGRDLKLRYIRPCSRLVKCDLANWNCFLVDREVIDSVGLIDNYYSHGFGDFDYSLRMKKAGFSIFVAFDYIGYCEKNPIANTFRDGKVDRERRIRLMLFDRKSDMSLKTTWHYYRRFGIRGVRYFLMPYIRFFCCLVFRKDYL